ncbi:nucleoside recognition membrane protein YjiH [Clostridium saccharobutylicum]|nr:nucleoside recognition membrane protein YjiH [Clostridium saccharobutylicum]
MIISVIESNNYISNFFRNLEQIFNLSPGILYGSFLGSIEITNGCNILSSIKISLCLKMSIISFLCSFSGLAIIAQVSSFVSHTKINFSKYIFLKVIQGIFSFVITYALIYILPTSIYTSTINSSSSLNVYLYFIPILILLVLTLLFHLFSKLFFHAT